MVFSNCNYTLQSVPVTTSKDMLHLVNPFVDGESTSSGSSYVCMDNIKRTLVQSDGTTLKNLANGERMLPIVREVIDTLKHASIVPSGPATKLANNEPKQKASWRDGSAQDSKGEQELA